MMRNPLILFLIAASFTIHLSYFPGIMREQDGNTVSEFSDDVCLRPCVLVANRSARAQLGQPEFMRIWIMNRYGVWEISRGEFEKLSDLSLLRERL